MEKKRSPRSSVFLDRVYRRSPKVVGRKIADEFILVPVEEGAGEHDAIYTLNPVAAELWQRLDGKKTLRAIAAGLRKKFNVGRSTVETDVCSFIRVLEKIRVVRWV